VAVKTIDVPYYSLIYKAQSLKRLVKKKINETSYDIAVAYLIHQPYMDAITYAKALNPHIKTVLICPDLPDMMDMSLAQKKLKLLLKKLDMKRVVRLYKKMDGFVLFADAMKERIGITENKYIVIEGVATVGDLDITPTEKEHFIMYAGTLHRNIGIENIIESIDYINDASLKLKLYGTGELEDYIKEIASKNPRIIYGGFIDRQTLFEEQKRAVALVNARNPKDAYTKYSFPSKTFEYLYSGTPFVTTKLEGVPNEYRQYLYETEDNRPQSIAKVINQILASDEKVIKDKGLQARLFVENKKNKERQSELLSDYFQTLIK
jgi:glycosyltransferase, family 1